MSRISIDGKPLSEEQSGAIRRAVEFCSDYVSSSDEPELAAVLALLDVAPPITSTACPNATETCSSTCAAWEGQPCNCKVAPPPVDLGADRKRTKAPTVAEIHKHEMWWFREKGRPADCVLLFEYKGSVFCDDKGDGISITDWRGEWEPCIPPIVDAVVADAWSETGPTVADVYDIGAKWWREQKGDDPQLIFLDDVDGNGTAFVAIETNGSRVPLPVGGKWHSLIRPVER